MQRTVAVCPLSPDEAGESGALEADQDFAGDALASAPE